MEKVIVVTNEINQQGVSALNSHLEDGWKVKFQPVLTSAIATSWTNGGWIETAIFVLEKKD